MTGEHGPATELWAHGLGGQRDLPIPLDLAVSGAVAALVVSFTVLAVAWRRPRYDAATSGRPAPAWLDALVSSTALLVVGMVRQPTVQWRRRLMPLRVRRNIILSCKCVRPFIRFEQKIL